VGTSEIKLQLTMLPVVGWNEAPTVGSFVLFQFYFTMCDMYKDCGGI